MTAAKVIHGDNLIYFFLKELVDAEDEGKRVVPVSMIQEMIRTTGIWLPHNLYARLPVLLPHVIRDPSCRGNKSKGVPDTWNAPDAKGYVRDDNSRIKGIPKSLSVSAPAKGKMRDARMGTEFVASHIWRVTNEKGVLASRQPLLNSFVPNLVWLPKQISKLSDREGGIVQRTLQSMSWALFRDAPVAESLGDVVKESWSLLPTPDLSIADLDLKGMNWFVADEKFISQRLSKIDKVRAALLEMEMGGAVPPKFESSRYVAGIPDVGLDQRVALRNHLERFHSQGVKDAVL